MGLNFPNPPIRRFDPGRSSRSSSRRCASWARKRGEGEAAVLSVFDENREAILKAAAAAYSKDRASYHRLTTASF